jgi:nicotinic acid mononucleotide adenylyltransferase
MIEYLATKLNASSWHGVISEVGVGIPFSAKYVSIPGASNTILWLESDYAGMENNPCVRAVSLENARDIAHKNLHRATKHVSLTEHSDQQHLFGLSITGAHYPKRPSHAWVYLATPDGDAYMHFYTKYPVTSRDELGKTVIQYVSWFLYNCLIENDWVRGLTENKWYIDVLYATGISDFERLLLLRENNPLAWNANGRLMRVEDLVRGTSTVYSGSFNPPTKRHLQNGEGSLLEISQKHVYKGDVSSEDLLHRIRMLQAAGRGVLVTKAAKFIDKYLLLLRYLDVSAKQKITFKVGVDAWNATIARHQYPSHDWLGAHMPFGRFEILPREGYSCEDSPITQNLDYTLADAPASAESSTSVRSADVPYEHDFLTPKISNYIKHHNLYEKNYYDSDLFGHRGCRSFRLG